MLSIKIRVNGVSHQVRTAANRSLLDLLREDLGLTGVKDACGQEGECGACTVIMDGKLVNSCLVLAGQADGCEIMTVEGLSSGSDLHPIQQAFIDSGAVQCGFCTSGALLSAFQLLQRHPHPTDEQIRAALSGNLCRCTGYTKMIAAVQRAAEELCHAS